MRCIRPAASAALLLVAALALVACSEVPPPDVTPVGPPPRLAGTPSYDALAEPASAVLRFVPAEATVLTVTDFDGIRAQLGVPDLTSADPMADRAEFWRRAATEAPLLTDGLLRDENSRLMLDYGFTQDDVDWEAHFRGPQGRGYVLGLRPDVDIGEVARAVRDGVGQLGGAEVLAAEGLVVSGGAEDASESWATDATMVALLGAPAEATYARRGCIPLTEALGPDDTPADLEAVLAAHDVEDLATLYGFVLEFGDHLATVRMDPELGDLFERLALGEDWPVTQQPVFGEEFLAGVGDPTTGRIGYSVPHPGAAAGLALLEALPFGICDEVVR